MEKELINEEFARNLLSWKHSGFSIDNSVRMLDRKSRKIIGQYMARPPLSLKKITYEPFKGKVLFHTTYSDYFKENLHMFNVLAFLAELTQHIPPKGVQLIRRYGVYSSRIKGAWDDMPYVAERAPAGWREEHAESEVSDASIDFDPFLEDDSVDSQTNKRAWARSISAASLALILRSSMRWTRLCVRNADWTLMTAGKWWKEAADYSLLSPCPWT